MAPTNKSLSTTVLLGGEEDGDEIENENETYRTQIVALGAWYTYFLLALVTTTKQSQISNSGDMVTGAS